MMRYRALTFHSIFLALLVLLPLAANAEELQLYVHKSVPIDSITLGDLRAIFTLRKEYWSDGTPINVLVESDKSLRHEAFCKNLLKIYPYQLRALWSKKFFSGMGSLPTIVSSQNEMLHIITSIKGSIGYLDDTREYSDVKKITIN